MPIKLHFSPHKQQHIAKKREGKWNRILGEHLAFFLDEKQPW